MTKKIVVTPYGNITCDATIYLDNIIEIISLYYNGLSVKTLNKRFGKVAVEAALHGVEFEVIRKHMQEEKREAFENYWKQEGIPRLRGDAE